MDSIKVTFLTFGLLGLLQTTPIRCQDLTDCAKKSEEIWIGSLKTVKKNPESIINLAIKIEKEKQLEKITKCKNLKRLKLVCPMLEAIPTEFEAFDSLKELYISAPLLENITEIKKLKGLEYFKVYSREELDSQLILLKSISPKTHVMFVALE